MRKKLLGLFLTLIFFLDTSDLNSVCCRQSVYDIREQKNINTHIQIQEDNDWIYDYEGPWVHYYY